MVYESNDGTPWQLFEVVNGFVMNSESTDVGEAITGK